ncbi:MAG: biopolymer transporter ExbD [Bacteriovoracaceae bacterium]|jgi:biopolymer transport protein ExbD|nr:biopolymer transporter ExbD [Bacteriovoracaceae bacterium]
MSYRLPTRRKVKKAQGGLNLVPILDAIFILIFFLLMSAQFVKIFEIGSDVPIVSNTPPPKTKKKPLNLTLKIRKSGLLLTTGLNQRVYTNIKKTKEGEYDLLRLHDVLISLKKKYKHEETIVFEPQVDLTYEEIVKIMDAVRLLKKTDDSIFTKDKDGIDIQLKTLFHKIMFGNLMS